MGILTDIRWYLIVVFIFISLMTSSHIQMWELDHKEGWALKNWCFWTMVLEKTFESPSDCKKIETVNPKGHKSWIFIENQMMLKLQYFCHLMWKANSLEKDCDAGKDWRQKKIGATEDEVVIQHHQLTDMNLSKCQETVKDKKGWHAVVHGVAKLDTTWWLNNSND